MLLHKQKQINKLQIMKKNLTLEQELKELENLPPLPKEEQKIVDAIAAIMVEKASEDLALGKHRKPEKRKK